MTYVFLRDALEQFDIFGPFFSCCLSFFPVNLNITHFFITFSLLFLFRISLSTFFVRYIEPRWRMQLLSWDWGWRKPDKFGVRRRKLCKLSVIRAKPFLVATTSPVAFLLIRFWNNRDANNKRAMPKHIFFQRVVKSFRAFPSLFLLFKSLFDLVVTILKDNILQKKSTNIGFVFFLFLTLLFLNIAGLFPFTFTVTSSFVVTLFFSLTVFLAANIMGIFHNGFYLLANFLPTGTPLFIAPLLILIEIISYFSRIFSLSIRLFANMLSGHGLLKILIGFSFVAFKTLEFWFFLGILPWLVVTIVLVLEVAIAFLQAYVFIILTAIYINDAINPH